MSTRLAIVVAAFVALIAVPAAGQAAPKVVGACTIAAKTSCPGANLKGQDLRGSDLRRANLKGADLRGANLRDATFARANLAGVDFTGADIRGVDFSRANLTGARLVRVKAGPPTAGRALGANCNASLQNTGGSMVNAQLQNATITGNYSYWNFNTAKMSGTTAAGVNFTCATFTSVNAASYAYVNAGTCVNPAEKTNLAKAVFTGADLSGTNLAGWSFTQVKTQTACGGGSYTPALSYYPDLTGVSFQNANLTNVSFRNAKLPATTSSLIAGATWSTTTCPQGTSATGAPCSPTSP